MKSFILLIFVFCYFCVNDAVAAAITTLNNTDERIQNGIVPYLGQFPHSITVFPSESGNTRCSGSIIHT